MDTPFIGNGHSMFVESHKATNVAMFIRNMDVSIEAMKAAEKTMSERRKSAERRRDSVKTYLLTNMVGCGIKKIEGPWRYSISTHPRVTAPTGEFISFALTPSDSNAHRQFERDVRRLKRTLALKYKEQTP
jgi:Siphovirus Gp157